MAKALLRFTLKFFSLMPLRANHAIGSFIGFLLYRIPNRLRHVTQTNINRCFKDLPEKKRKNLVYETLKHSGKSLTELGALWHWPLSKIQAKVTQVHNESLLQQAVSSGRGVLCLTPHLGSWELSSLYFADKYPAVCLYRPPRQKVIANYIQNTRERFGTTLVPTSAAGIKALYVSLNAGKTVGLLPDQDPGKNKGVYTTFFGLPCNTMPLVAKLIRKTQAMVLFLTAIRLEHGKGYEIFIEQLDYDLEQMNNEAILEKITSTIETAVRKTPEQYQWTYKRFKYQPDGSRFYSN